MTRLMADNSLIVTKPARGIRHTRGAPDFSFCTFMADHVSRHPFRAERLDVRGQQLQVLQWGDPAQATDTAPLTVLVHGWMDVAASYQFLVDALRAQPGWRTRPLLALDWRGFGGSYLASGPAPDGDYAYVDYLADLDAVLDRVSSGRAVNLIGHSMGGNVVMLYAGARPGRIRRLVNLEGVGLPVAAPEEAPRRLAAWLDGLKTPVALKDYDSVAAVAARLRQNNPRLTPERAQWLAGHWAHEAGGRWHINADPAHKRPGPHLYRLEEVLATWRAITAPTLVVEGADTAVYQFFNGRHTRDDFLQRVAVLQNTTHRVLPDAGHMLHHDQPEELAAWLADFLG
jgi:pimeloyl-ACP methyl ester carboxylesterase